MKSPNNLEKYIREKKKEFDKFFWKNEIEPNSDFLTWDYKGNWVVIYQECLKQQIQAIREAYEIGKSERDQEITKNAFKMLSKDYGWTETKGIGGIKVLSWERKK